MTNATYIPALRYKWLTPLYDFFLGLTMPEKKIKLALIEAAGVSPRMKVLDFGCGTGTLTIMIKEFQPGVNVAGIDVDVQILNKAIKKIEQKGLDIFVIDYNGTEIPFQDEVFNITMSCLVFHHLDTSTKQKALAEMFRVIKKDGLLHIADFGRSKSLVQRTLFNLIRTLDGFKSTDANAKGLLPELISDVGFENVTIKKRFKTMFGEVQIISGEKIGGH